MRSGVAIISGGSAWNSYVSMIQNVADDVIYIMPVSDDGIPTFWFFFSPGDLSGGSTSEIVRTFGGPGIGDLRSRLIRLANVSTPEVGVASGNGELTIL